MRNITRPGEKNSYYMYKDYFIVRTWPQGYYSTHTRGAGHIYHLVLSDTAKIATIEAAELLKL